MQDDRCVDVAFEKHAINGMLGIWVATSGRAFYLRGFKEVWRRGGYLRFRQVLYIWLGAFYRCSQARTGNFGKCQMGWTTTSNVRKKLLENLLAVALLLLDQPVWLGLHCSKIVNRLYCKACAQSGTCHHLALPF